MAGDAITVSSVMWENWTRGFRTFLYWQFWSAMTYVWDVNIRKYRGPFSICVFVFNVNLMFAVCVRSVPHFSCFIVTVEYDGTGET